MCVIVCLILIGIIGVSGGSAGLNAKTYDSLNKEYTIKASAGLGDTIAKYKLLYNTDFCITDCYAIIETTLYSKERLTDGIEFRDKQDALRQLTYSYKIKTGEKRKIIQVPEYRQDCKWVDNELGKGEQCTDRLTGYREQEVTEDIYSDYKGEELVPGVYKWKIEGKKGSKESIDWIVTSLGLKLSEWALWQSGEVLGYWDFNEAGGWAAQDFLNITNMSGTILTRGTGMYGNAGYYDGTKYLVNDTLNNIYNQTRTEGSISMWVNITSNVTYKFLVSASVSALSSAAASSWDLSINDPDSPDSKLLGRVTIYGTAYNAYYTPTLGVWKHVVMTWNSTNLRIYENAVMKNQTAISGTLNPINFLNFGRRQDNNHKYVGWMDEVGIWNRTLTPEEISDLYNDGYGIPYGFVNELNISLDHPANASVNPGDGAILDVFLNVSGIEGGHSWKNITYYVWNSSTNELVNQTTYNLSGTYNSSSKYITGLIENNSYLWNAYGCYGSAFDTVCSIATNNNSFSVRKIKLNFSNGVSAIYPSCTMGYGSLSGSNMYWGGNWYNDSLTCTLTGYTNYNDVFDITGGDQNFNMSTATILLWFYNYNNTLNSTSGYWSNTYETQNFTGNSLSLDVSSSINGLTKVYFGYNVSLMNYTQFYEFNNKWVGGALENLTLITTPTNPVYIKVRNDGGDPVNDALIKVAMSNPAYGGVYKEIGQRITEGTGMSGMTFFNIPSDSMVYIRVSADGYEANFTIITNLQTNEFTSSNPLIVDLKRGNNTVYRGSFFDTYSYYNVNMSYVPLYMYSPIATNVSYNTSFLGELYPIPLNVYKYGLVNMTRGTQYCNSCNTSLVVYVYIDGSYWNSYNLTYRASEEDKFNIPTGMNSDILLKIVWIGLIMVVGVVGLMFKGSDEVIGSGKVGKMLFMIGALIIPLVFIGQFIALLIVVVMFGIGQIIRRFISE